MQVSGRLQCPGYFIPGEITSFNMRLGRPQRWSAYFGRNQNLFPLLGIKTQNIQPKA